MVQKLFRSWLEDTRDFFPLFRSFLKYIIPIGLQTCCWFWWRPGSKNICDILRHNQVTMMMRMHVTVSRMMNKQTRKACFISSTQHCRHLVKMNLFWIINITWQSKFFFLKSQQVKECFDNSLVLRYFWFGCIFPLDFIPAICSQNVGQLFKFVDPWD